MEHEKKGFLARYVKIIVVFAVMAGASSGIFGSVIEAPSMAIGFWRLSLGLPFFAVPVLMNQRDVLKTISKKDYFWTFIAGMFLFLHFFTWFNAVKLTDIASASVLAALHPLVVVLVTVFVFRRKVDIRPILGIILALAGGALIAGLEYRMPSSGSFSGNVLAFAAAMFMGLYFTVGNEVRRNVPGAVYVFLMFLSCWICFAVGMAATGTPVFGYSTADYLYIIGLTLVCQIGAHAVFNLCLGHVSSLYVSAWESGECVFSIILGVIFLGQIPDLTQLIGGAIVVIGLLYYNYYTAQEEKSGNEL